MAIGTRLSVEDGLNKAYTSLFANLPSWTRLFAMWNYGSRGLPPYFPVTDKPVEGVPEKFRVTSAFLRS